jgi:pyridoxal phosphate enzyme (YggS family)
MGDDYFNRIKKNASIIQSSLPEGILMVAAAKKKSADEVKAAIQAGVTIIGHNYVQEAERMREVVDGSVKWHMIGHLQRNKVKTAIRLFDMIETIDSVRLAEEVNRHCNAAGKAMPVLIEINSGEESSKTGVLPENAEKLILQINHLPHLKILGLMTMGPRFGNPEDARPYFKITRSIFEKLRNENIPNVEMRYLSMGMSNSYRIAIEEGANIIRVGTALFGERK